MLYAALTGLIYKPFLICAVLCALILFLLLRSGWAWSLATDVPTHRSLHTRPTPRVGGWGVTPASVFGIVYFAPQLTWCAWLALALAALCQIDDRRGLSARVRFAAQTAAALALCLIYLPLPWWSWPFVIIGLVWMTNLYNFMDGADGLAGGMALIGFATYAVAAWSFSPTFAAAAAAVSGAALGFLCFNWPPARMFLGDAGSIPLGFLAGALGLIGTFAHIWPLWFPVMVFSPFILDASVTLLRRLLRGERIWEAHRQHFYQRMIQMDGSHRRTIYLWYGLMLSGAMLALGMLQLQDAMGALSALPVGGAWMLLLFMLARGVDRRWARFKEIEDKK